MAKTGHCAICDKSTVLCEGWLYRGWCFPCITDLHTVRIGGQQRRVREGRTFATGTVRDPEADHKGDSACRNSEAAA